MGHSFLTEVLDNRSDFKLFHFANVSHPRSPLKSALHKQPKIVSGYDQEIPQSQTADNPIGKRHTTITRHQEDKLRKATSSFFTIKMIAKLEWT